MADITEQMSLVTSTPDEAAQHIDGAQYFDVDPVSFKASKEVYQPELEAFNRPSEALPVVSEYVRTSPEHAALIAPDVPIFNDMERAVTYGSRMIAGIPSNQEEIAKLEAKKLKDFDNFTEEDQFVLDELRADANVPVDPTVKDPAMDPKLWKHAELIKEAQGVPAQEEPGWLEQVSPAFNVGALGLASSLTKVPAFLANLKTTFDNLTWEGPAQPLIEIENEYSKKLDNMASELSILAPGTSKDLFASDSGAEFISNLSLKVIQNSPQQIALLTSALSGAGAVGLVAMGLTSASSKASELQNQGDVSDNTIMLNASITGAIEAVFEEFGTMGLVKKLQKNIATNFGQMAAKQFIYNFGKQTAITIFGEGMEEGTTSIAQDFTDYATGTNPKALEGIGERALEAMAIGAASSATMTIPSATGKAFKKISAESSNIVLSENNSGNLNLEAEKSLHLDSTLSALVEFGKTTEMQNRSPEQQLSIKKRLLENKHLSKVWVGIDAVKEWAGNNPEKQASVIKMLSNVDESLVELGGTVEVETYTTLDIIKENPDFTQWLQLHPEGINPSQAEAILKKKIETDKKKTEIFKKLNVPEISAKDRPSLESELQEIAAADEIKSDIFDEPSFLDQSKEAEAFKLLMTEDQATKQLTDELVPKKEIVANIKETQELEMNQVKDILVEQQNEIAAQEELDKLEKDPNQKLVAAFKESFSPIMGQQTRYKAMSELTMAHWRKGFSPFAIDPRTLSAAQKKAYLADPQLKKHKVFVNGGLSANESAALLGMSNGNQLLRTMAKTPSKEDIVASKMVLIEKKNRDIANREVEINETATMKAYSATQANNAERLKYMLTHKWTTKKALIKHIASPAVKVAELTEKARGMIGQTQVGKLNSTQFKRGARRSNRLAIENVLKGDDSAIQHQVNLVLNTALEEATLKATAKVNRVKALALRMQTKDYQKKLENAGRLTAKYHGPSHKSSFVDAVDELLATFNLSMTPAKTEKQGTFLILAQALLDTGHPNIQIPRELTADIRTSLQDMTVEQVLAIGDTLKTIDKVAREYDKVYLIEKGKQEALALDAAVSGIVGEAESHWDFKPERNDLVQVGERTAKETKIGAGLRDFNSSMERAQHVIAKMSGIVDGHLMKVWDTIRTATDNKKAMALEYRTKLEDIIKQFEGDSTDFRDMLATEVDVPEFEGFSELGHGKISMMKLWMMSLNMGNEGNLVTLERFGADKHIMKNGKMVTESSLDRQTMQRILERHLDHKHWVMTQNIWNLFETFKPHIQALTERMEGNKVEFVKAKPLAVKGQDGKTVVLDGGYFPLHLLTDTTRLQSEKLAGTAEQSRIDKLVPRYHASAQTEKGHLETRTNNTSVLDLDVSRIGHSLAQVIHDLTMRETIRDATKVLTHPDAKRAIISVVDKRGYSTITDMVVDVADAVDNGSYKTSDPWLKGLETLGGGVQAVMIGMKLTSILSQTLSLPFALRRMGAKNGLKHFAKIFRIAASHPLKIHSLLEVAKEIHPTVAAVAEDVVGDIAVSLAEALPKERSKLNINLGGKKLATGKAVDAVVAGRDLITAGSMGALAQVDQALKAIVVNAAYSQAINGEAIDNLGKPIEGGDHDKAVLYARAITELTQTHNDIQNQSAIQKNKWFKASGLLYFFADVNNNYNNIVNEGRQAKQKYKETGDLVAKKQYKLAAQVGARGVFGLMGLLLTYALMEDLDDRIHGQETPLDDVLFDPKMKNKAKAVAEMTLMQPLNVLLGSIPIVSNVQFASGKYWMKRKTVTTPVTDALSDFTTAIVSVTHLLENGKIDKTDKKAILMSLGYLTKLPTGAYWKYTEKPFKKKGGFGQKGIIEQFISAADEYLKTEDDGSEFSEQIKQLKEDLSLEESPVEETASIDNLTE